VINRLIIDDRRVKLKVTKNTIVTSKRKSIRENQKDSPQRKQKS